MMLPMTSEVDDEMTINESNDGYCIETPDDPGFDSPELKKGKLVFPGARII